MQDRTRFAAAFRELRSKNYVARMNYSCCMSCAGNKLELEYEDLHKRPGYVYWHKQDNDSFSAGRLMRTMHIRHGLSDASALEVIEVLQRHLEPAGICVIWTRHDVTIECRRIHSTNHKIVSTTYYKLEGEPRMQSRHETQEERAQFEDWVVKQNPEFMSTKVHR